MEAFVFNQKKYELANKEEAYIQAKKRVYLNDMERR
jgi:hypothetical protein